MQKFRMHPSVEIRFPFSNFSWFERHFQKGLFSGSVLFMGIGVDGGHTCSCRKYWRMNCLTYSSDLNVYEVKDLILVRG